MSTTIVLNKGKSINLTKAAKLTKFRFGLSWDESADLDAVAMVLTDAGKMIDPQTDAGVAYYGNCTGNAHGKPENPVAGIVHFGDARDGAADGDDETIEIDTSLVTQNKILIAVTSYSDGDAVPFAGSANPVAKLYDEKGDVLLEMKIEESAAFSTAFNFVMLERDATSGDWMITTISEPVGNSNKNGLVDLIEAHK